MALEAAAPPAKKKHKRSSSSVEDADARLAAELQAQENRLARGRTTRGGSSAAVKPRKKTPKKKSAAKVKKSSGGGGDGSDADSDDGSGEAKEGRKSGGGYQKPYNLSYQLSELVGSAQVGSLFAAGTVATANFSSRSSLACRS